ncbi:TMhelix containing protein [Vibrio phage 1.084.O._10N.261.49.F5]|nr:TMhelix containing protein [Vibrio phage 1.084.O._10N.261.49.F5]
MNNVTKQIIIGVGVAIFSAVVWGAKDIYDDTKSNKIQIEAVLEADQKVHQKLDLILNNQTHIKKDIAVLQENQKHLMEGRFNE